MSYGILVDVTRCTGCEQCVDACMRSHASGSERPDQARLTKQSDLSAHQLTTVTKIDDGRFARKSCMHCVEPSCVSACLVGALTKSDEGPVIYDPQKCIGCRYCMLACPFHVPRYEWDKTVPFVKKCDMCFSRVQKGQQPACVEACSNQALLFGERDELLNEAHRRIAGAHSRYVQHVWGENEFGGTSVLYISDVDLSDLDWPEVNPGPIPLLTESLIESTPFIGFGVASGLLGVNWVIRRRMQLERKKSSRDQVTTDPDAENTNDG